MKQNVSLNKKQKAEYYVQFNKNAVNISADQVFFFVRFLVVAGANSFC